ncbi:hypothetical protein M7I_6337 [Glarea lozoyensis 74030]|uniref:FAD-binding domain-containing protein n=1 Tax=Glarea lozoyensis (strain ATCC 74030 / MF5533) TaxID=1104152 RepID=H0EUA5_GLAL7|nr:hypothetical protein M7I_6337 [Glarea lozoyensis 74030]
MGLFDEIKSKSSNEEGIRLMTKHDKVLAAFGVDADSGKGESATCDIEILRGELAKILVDATKTDVTYIWGDMIESLHETEKEIDERLARFRKVLKEGVPAQKALLQELFEDAGWEASRLLEGMHQSDDFYLQHVAQVKIDKWSTPSGRVTMVGDAGFAPSPFSGMGTSIAFIGAYVLAGEISKQLENIPAALESYERILRPYVEDIQSLPPGIPWALIPQSNIGVKLLETVFRTIGFLSRTGVTTVIGNILGYLPFAGGVKFKLPEYEAFKKRS